MHGVPRWLTRDRALALGGLAGLFTVAVLVFSMILGATGGGDEEEVASAPARSATPTATPEPTPRPTPTPVPLTAAERAQRRAAADQVRQQGYQPVSLRAYHPDQTLRVLLGEPSPATRAAGVPEGRRAFFFVGDAYVDTDAPEVSSELRILRQTENTVSLRYGLDAGDGATVRFRWDGATLASQQAVPPAESRQR